MRTIAVSLALAAVTAMSAHEKPLADGLYAEFVTPRGNFICELFYKKAALTVANFSGLAEGKLGPEPRKPFFDALKFHRVVADFVVQGGDPEGTGEGGPGYEFPDEFAPGLRHDDIGILSMANAGPDTNGSQFFLTLRPVNRLNYLHSVFGRTVHGIEVLPQINQDDVITAVRILRIGSDAQKFQNDQAAFDRLKSAARLYTGSPEPGPKAHFDDPEKLLPVDPARGLYFNYKLANVERATGLRINARLFGRYIPGTPGQRPGTFTGALARELGFADESVLITYFADIDRWGLWVGDQQLARLMGRSGTVKEFMQDSALHHAKQSLVETAEAQAEILVRANAAFAASLGKPFTDADRLKARVDAMLDMVIMRFEPQP